MPTYITELDVSLDDAYEDYLQKKGFKKLDVNLNSNGSPGVYLWYKEGSRDNSITRIQFSFTDSMAEGLGASGFIKVDKNLNTGSCGDKVFLWYFNGNTDSHVPITKIEATHKDDDMKFASGWERMSCNMNRSSGGLCAFLWVERETKTYIQEMKVTNDYGKDVEYFEKGYIRVDESTNRGPSGKPVFLWYLPTTKKEGSYVTLRVSTTKEEYDRYKSEGINLVIPRVNLNEGNQGNEVYLWYKKEDPGQNPIQNITLLSNQELIQIYVKVGVIVRPGNLNSGGASQWFPATPLYLAYFNL